MELTTVNLTIVALGTLAFALALLLAIIVYRARPDGRMNRRLSWLLIADAVFIAGLVLDTLTSYSETRYGEAFLNVVLCAEAMFHVLFVMTLDSPVARMLRRPAAVAAIIGVTLLVAIILPTYGYITGQRGEQEATDFWFGSGWILLAGASLFVLAVAVDAYLRAPKGTPTRHRTGLFALAFGARDIGFIASILFWVALERQGQTELRDATPILMASMNVMFVVLLAYALLSVQLFDIDLKIKWGAARGAVVVFIVIAALATAKIVESYVNRTLGLAFGGVMAGITLFLAPRLNKIADKVANRALPQVKETSEYLAFKKLEVYRAAIESAMEGGLTPKDRGMLNRLQEKLGLNKADAAALEAEYQLPAGTPGASAAG